MTTIVKQCVHRLLKHALLVTDNDVRSFELKKVLQAVVPVNDTTVKVVKVRCGESSAFQWHQWTKVRRDHWEHVHNHPLWACLALGKSTSEFDTLGELLLSLLGASILHLFFKLNRKLCEVDTRKQ